MKMTKTHLTTLVAILLAVQATNAVAAPATPTSPSPGSTSSPGPTQSSSTVSLSWGSSSGATYYSLGVRDVATGNLVVDTTTTSTSYTASLTAGKAYRWNVAACNTAGCSSYTTVLYFQTPTAVVIPATPTSPSPGSTSSPGPTQSSSTVSWSWGSSSGATYYSLGVRDVATGSLVVDTTTTSTSYTASLTAGKAYRWNIAAGNTAGLSSYTTVLYFQTPAAVVIPATPTSPSPGSTSSPGPTQSSSTVTLSWGASSGATYYDVGVRDIASGIIVASGYPTTTSFTTTLTAGKAYRWNVAADNTAGESTFTTPLYFQTPTSVVIPATPTSPSPGSTSSPGPTQSSTTVTLSWSASSGATYYDVGVRDIASGTIVASGYPTTTSFTTTLTAGKTYRWNVAADNTAGESAFTTPLYFQTPTSVVIPSTPTSPSPGSTSSPGPTQSSTTVTLSWGASSGATYYSLGVRDIATGVLVVSTTTTSTSYSAALTAGKAYRWDVAAGNTAGLSSYTTVLYFLTPTAVVIPATPTSPSPGTTSSPGPTQSSSTVTLSWGSSSGATYYSLGVRDIATDVLVVSTTTTTPSYTAALTAGKAYRWNVAAGNMAGLSSYTTPLYFQTPTTVAASPSINNVNPAQPLATNVNQNFTIYGSNFDSTAYVNLKDNGGMVHSLSGSRIISQNNLQITVNPNFTSLGVGTWYAQVVNGSGTPSTWFSFHVAARPGTQFGVDYRNTTANATTATEGVDVPGIKTAGKQFVCEYIGTADNDGYLRPADVTALTNQGLEIVSIFERSPTSTSYFTVNQADSDAAVAIAAAIEAGQPSGSAIYFTVDYPADSTAFSAIDSYFREIRNYFNQYFSAHPGITFDIGVYAPGNVLPTIMSDASVGASYSWVAEPFGSPYSSANLAQTQDNTPTNPIVIGGVHVDLDEAYTENFGQWSNSLPVTPPSPSNVPGVNLGHPQPGDTSPAAYCGLNPFFHNNVYGGQCTAFCWGRVKEKLGISLETEFYGNAQTWWNQHSYQSGPVAQPNSIAVWSYSGGGHVAFVEDVSGDQVAFNEANVKTHKDTNWGGGYDGVDGMVAGPKTKTKTQMSQRQLLISDTSTVLLGYIYLGQPTQNYMVTPSTDSTGNISPSTPQTVPTLGGVTFTASPATISAATKSAVIMEATTSYVVDQWLVNGLPAQSGGTNFTLLNVTADTAVQVTFKSAPGVSYMVTPTAAANGIISPDSEQLVASGDSVTFTALPDSGYAVDQWQINNVATQYGGASFTLSNVTAPTTVQVAFNAMLDGSNTITASPVPSYGGTVSGGGVFLAGGQQTVTAAANPGYSFINWTENGTEVSSLTNYTFTLMANRTLVANFTATLVMASDTNAPAIVITQPYSSGAFVTTTNTVNLAGTASDLCHGDTGISIVTVNGIEAIDDTTANGGTANWYATIALNPGTNIITVVAKDTFNNSSQQQITVTYTQTGNVQVKKCTVTTGSKGDSISFSGTMSATAGDFNDANNSSDANFVEVTISDENSEYMDPCVITFPVNGKTWKKGKFSYSGTENGVKKSFSYVVKTGKFSFAASNIDLSGLECPMTIDINVGGFAGTTDVNETIVNGKKPIPINLLMGVKDSLRVDKSKLTRNKNTKNITQLAVSGGFSVADLNDANLVTNPLDVNIGSQTFTIPAHNFKNAKGKFTCSKVKLYDSSDNLTGIAAATFDFNKCTFTLTIKKTNFAATTGTTDFGIAFGGFSGSDEVTLP